VREAQLLVFAAGQSGDVNKTIVKRCAREN